MNYCKLYIDYDFDKKSVEIMLNDVVSIFFGKNYVAWDVYKNDAYVFGVSPNSRGYPIERSRFYAEIDVEPDSNIGEHEFQLGVAKIIKELRNRSCYVVASCDFEDLISDVTGWNWTPEQPIPPH